MDEIVRKRKLKSRAGRKAAQEEQHLVEESTTLHSNFYKNLYKILFKKKFSQR